VSGRVRRDDDLPLEGGLVRAFHESERGAFGLGEDTTDAEGCYTIRYELLPEVSSVDLRVEAYDEDGTRLQSSEVIREARPLEIVDLVAAIVSMPSEQRRLEGRVVFDNGLPAEQLALRLYRLDFGGVETRLSETITRELGDHRRGLSCPGGRQAVDRFFDDRPSSDTVWLFEASPGLSHGTEGSRVEHNTYRRTMDETMKCFAASRVEAIRKPQQELGLELIRDHLLSGDAWMKRWMIAGSFLKARVCRQATHVAIIQRSAVQKGCETCLIG
jgi:hypothetical protein